jgi:NADH:ubiquinone reductase (non-electrogenic)
MSPERKRLLILGTGFGAFHVAKYVGPQYDVTVVSPRNHFLFTPLLPSTTVGSIEFRSIIEPIRHARKDLRFYHAVAVGVDPGARTVQCTGITDGHQFSVDYDVLVVAVGAGRNTFNVPGVAEHALFLKELTDARMLRGRIIQCFERANLPGITTDERRSLLHFVVCGGGPTGVEFAAELNDFLVEDLSRVYPRLMPETRITLVEAMKEILGTFDEKLRRYATDLFLRQNIRILLDAPVVRVDSSVVHLKNGSLLPYGLLLWTTGIGPTRFARLADLPKDNRARFLTDGFFRVQGHEDIYALGDCGNVEGANLPATAQVAQQEGKYLARALTRRARGEPVAPFRYRDLGMLAYVGGDRALADLQGFKGRGWATWIFWRSAYLTRIVSLKNKVKVLADWMTAQIFGRDISQF